MLAGRRIAVVMPAYNEAKLIRGALEGIPSFVDHIIVVWDRLRVHQAKKIMAWASNHRRVELVELPPYAPELNPPEYLFGYIKTNPLANWAPPHADILAEGAIHYLCQLKKRPDLLCSFFEASPLSLFSR